MVKPVCTPDCPDRHPACSDRCEKYRAWKAEVQKEKTYTKSQNDAGKINRNDFDAEFWMGGKHKKRAPGGAGCARPGALATAGASGRTGAARGKALAAGV